MQHNYCSFHQIIVFHLVTSFSHTSDRFQYLPPLFAKILIFSKECVLGFRKTITGSTFTSDLYSIFLIVVRLANFDFNYLYFYNFKKIFI